MALKKFEQFETDNNKLKEIINTYDDFDEQNYEFAKWIFQQEENREPDMDTTKDMNCVAMLEVGVRYARNYNK